MEEQQNNFDKENTYYDHTFDIIPFYGKVCNYLVEKSKRTFFINKDIGRLYSLMNNENKIQIRIILESYARELTKLENYGTFHDYNNEILIIIKKYKQLCLSTEITLDDNKRKLFNENKERITIIDEFFNITKNYYPVALKRKFKELSKCDICGGIINNGKCSICNINMNTTIEETDWSDPKIVKNKNTYDPRNNFKEIIYSFQGKQQKNIPDSVYQKIRTKIKENRIDEKEITKKQLCKIMKSLRLSDYYDDKNLIHSILTNKKPPNIKKYERNLFLRHQKVVPLYKKYKKSTRKNFAHGHSFLYICLKLEGCNCRKEDFNLIKTDDILQEFIILMKNICNELIRTDINMNWDFNIIDL